MNFAKTQDILRRAGATIAPGLSQGEFDGIERRWGFRFPPDLREFLSIGLPVSEGWVNWRDEDEATIKGRFEWPLDGINFDIVHNDFWLPEWGSRESQDVFEVARRAVAQAPVLIPVYRHRYLPATPCESGSPVFSVYQTDIIYYGTDLRDYLANEFPAAFARSEPIFNVPPRAIPFWSRLVDLNG